MLCIMEARSGWLLGSTNLFSLGPEIVVLIWGAKSPVSAKGKNHKIMGSHVPRLPACKKLLAMNTAIVPLNPGRMNN